MQKYIKEQNILMMAGQGIVMLCGVSMLKLIMYLTIDKNYFIKLFELEGLSVDGSKLITADNSVVIEKSLVMLVMIITIMIDAFIRYKIGKAAMNTARGGKLKIRYYLLTILCIGMSVLSLWPSIQNYADSIIFEQITGGILEVVADILFIVLFVSAIRISRFRRELNIS